MRTRHKAATTAAILLTLTACSSNTPDTKPSSLDQAGQLACDDFATGYKAAQTSNARTDLADKVNKWAQQSKTDRIPEMATALARGSARTAEAWTIGADAFAQACLDAGWKAD